MYFAKKVLVNMPLTSECKIPLVFIPGWGGDERTWRKLINALESLYGNKYECLCINLPFNEAREIQSLKQEVHLLANKIPDNSLLVAWSLGGMLATQIASAFPHKIKQLVLLACNPCFVASADWPAAMAQEINQNFYDNFESAPVKTLKRFNALQVQGCTERKTLLVSMASDCAINDGNHKVALNLLAFLANINNSEILFELSQPVLSIFGSDDALVPIQSAQLMLDKSQNTQANIQVEVIKNSGHIAHISHAESVAVLIDSFFNQSPKHSRYFKDKRRIADSFSKASKTYDKYAHLQRTVADDLCKWGGELSGTILDLGCGTGYCLEKIKNTNLEQKCLGLDISFDMLTTARSKLLSSSTEKDISWLCSDMEYLPFACDSFDTVISSLAVQWSETLSQVFASVAGILKPGGQFLFSTLGPATLNELRSAWQAAAPDHIHVNDFTAAESVLDAAALYNFELQLHAADIHMLEFDCAQDLMRELKGIGAHNVNSGGNKGLTGTKALSSMIAHYNAQRLENGKLPATYQVYYWLFTKKRES